MDRRDLERRGDAPDEQPGHVLDEPGDEQEERQVVDEPERAPRLDKGVKVFAHDAGPAHLGGEAGRLEGELDGEPEHVEVGEMQDLAVEIEPPGRVDAARQEEAGDEEEVGHAEGPGELDEIAHPAGLARRLLHAERGMHHHDEADTNALGDVDPIDPVLHGALLNPTAPSP